MCFEGEKWAMNSDHSEIEGEKKKGKPSSNKNLFMISLLMEMLASVPVHWVMEI